MMNKLKSYLAGFDKLGSSTLLKYKTQTSYGTVIGGICCILVNIVIFAFWVTQLSLFGPSLTGSIRLWDWEKEAL